jgi:hypothetical protein
VTPLHPDMTNHAELEGVEKLLLDPAARPG